MSSSYPIGFGTPASVLTGGQTFSTEATDINSGFGAVTPPPNTTAVPMPAVTSIPSICGPNGFNDAQAGSGSQNIITDPNQTGVTTPGMTTYGGGALANPGSIPGGQNPAAGYTTGDAL